MRFRRRGGSVFLVSLRRRRKLYRHTPQSYAYLRGRKRFRPIPDMEPMCWVLRSAQTAAIVRTMRNAMPHRPGAPRRARLLVPSLTSGFPADMCNEESNGLENRCGIRLDRGRMFGCWSGTGQPLIPTLTSVSPTSVPANISLTLALYGTNLVSGTNVVVSGQVISNTFCFSSPCPITYVSSRQLTVFLPASQVASPGPLWIQVENDGGTSNSVTMTVTAAGAANPSPPAGAQPNLAPRITWMAPLTTTAGGPATQITVYGANFSAASTVQWNGSTRPGI